MTVSPLWVLVVEAHFLVSNQGSPGEHSHTAAAQQDDTQLQEVPLTPEVRPVLLLHQFALLEGKKKIKLEKNNVFFC